MEGKDLISVTDLDQDDVLGIIQDAIKLKQVERLSILEGKTMALIFEKQSLRTRVSFEVAMHKLGGHTIYLSHIEVGMGEREPISDVAGVLSRYVDVIVARTFSHGSVEFLAKHATVPVINGLTDLEHPCQAISDLLTIYERKGDLKGLTIAFIGDGNNVANSLLLISALVGINFRFAGPRKYYIQERILVIARRLARRSGAEIFLTDDPSAAVRGADVVYTDVWISMGQESERRRKIRDFAGYQVNPNLLARAKEDAILMHPMPAHYGEEISEQFINDPQAVLFDQAENRLHVQTAILAGMLGKKVPKT